jgi:hypothetical protein
MGDKKKSKKDKSGKSKKEGKAPKANNSETVMKKYAGSIALSKLKHVIMTKKGKKKKIKGIFIPIKENYLIEGENGAVYMNLNVVTKSPQDEYGQNGFISQNGNKKWSEASEKEKDAFRNLSILGNIKDFDDSKPESTDNSGSHGEINEDDDLPF